MTYTEPLHARLDDMLTRVAVAGPRPSVSAFTHGTLEVKMYAPRGTDPQQPHDRDELYVVARGTGRFWIEDDSVPFVTGDVLFAPAGIAHRFEGFSDDFAVWVMFYGPEGGERPEG